MCVFWGLLDTPAVRKWGSKIRNRERLTYSICSIGPTLSWNLDLDAAQICDILRQGTGSSWPIIRYRIPVRWGHTLDMVFHFNQGQCKERAVSLSLLQLILLVVGRLRASVLKWGLHCSLVTSWSYSEELWGVEGQINTWRVPEISVVSHT